MYAATAVAACMLQQHKGDEGLCPYTPLDSGVQEQCCK